MDKCIYLQPMQKSSSEPVKPEILDRLCRELRQVFGLECRVCPPMELPPAAYLVVRGQYLAAELLADLKSQRYSGADRVLAITNGDLCAEGLNFVFGQAELGGRFAIISTHRLSASTSRGDGRLFSSRVLKEATHEIGHTLGLGHCPNLRCIMHFSNTLEDTDLKGPGFCDGCTARLNGNLRRAV